MGKSCIELLQGKEEGSANPQKEGDNAAQAGENKVSGKRGRGKKDVRLKEGDKILTAGSSVECVGCGRWVNAKDVDVVGMLDSEVRKMEVFCMRCTYGVLSELRAELRGARDEICALREAHLSSSAQVTELLAEKCKCKCRCNVNERNNTRVESGTSLAHKEQGETTIPSVPEVVQSSERPVIPEQSRENVKRTRTPPQGTEPQVSDDEGFTMVQRKRRRVKQTINLVGDSMLRNVTKVIKCGEEGSGCTSLRGAGIKQIMQNASLNASTIETNGILILQGDGNSLHALGTKETVKSVMSTVKEIKERRPDVKLAVLSIMPRPKEGKKYESMRLAANRELQAQLCDMKVSLLQKGEGDISFMDMDSSLPKEAFAKDGVHLNGEGDVWLGKRLLQWIKEKERCYESDQ